MHPLRLRAACLRSGGDSIYIHVAFSIGGVTKDASFTFFDIIGSLDMIKDLTNVSPSMQTLSPSLMVKQNKSSVANKSPSPSPNQP